jgi:HSP20 family protein
MTLIKRVNTLPGLLENYFGRDFNEFAGTRFDATLPAVNVIEDKDDFKIEVAAPGLKKENFKLSVKHNRLTIASQVETGQEEKADQRPEVKYTRKEFNFDTFQRNFTLPQSVDTEKISASYIDGILTISLPKREEAKVKPVREIAIA